MKPSLRNLILDLGQLWWYALPITNFLRFGNWIYWANIAVPRPDPCQFLLRQRPVESTDLIQKWAIARRQHFCVTFHFVANVVKIWPSSFNLPLPSLRYLSSHSLSDAISNFFSVWRSSFSPHCLYILQIVFDGCDLRCAATETSRLPNAMHI